MREYEPIWRRCKNCYSNWNVGHMFMQNEYDICGIYTWECPNCHHDNRFSVKEYIIRKDSEK